MGLGRPPQRDSRASPGPLLDERGGASNLNTMQRGLMSAFNGGMREVERGALGLPQDKLVLVREKKEDIERVRVPSVGAGYNGRAL